MTYVCGFPGVGKTHWCNNNRLNTHDSDNTQYTTLPDGSPNPNFVVDYFRQLENLQYMPGLMVFVSADELVLDEFQRRGMNYYVVIPEEGLLREYVDRYIDNGTPQIVIDTIIRNWHPWLQDIKSKHSYFELKSGETLTDFMIRTYETGHNGTQAVDPERFK